MRTEFAADSMGRSIESDSARGELSESFLWALLVLLGCLHLSMAIGRGINWDEFWYYSQVEQLARGEYIQPLQTIHTRIFAWLPGLPGSEIDHILIARLFMLGCVAATTASIGLVAETFSNRRIALLAAAMYLGAGFVLQHGTSFRVDPIAAALLSVALAIVVRAQMNWGSSITIGLLVGLVAMVSIKFVLWAPAFAGVALWRWHEHGLKPTYLLHCAFSALVAALTFALIYYLHSIPGGTIDVANQSTQSLASSSATKMFGFMHSPYLVFMGRGAIISLPFAMAAIFFLIVLKNTETHWTRRVAAIGLWLPILTPLFYHNSAPYVYTFLLPPVAMACAISLPYLTRRYGEAFFAILIACNAVGIWFVDERDVLPSQRQFVGAVHKLFPEPVAYFDQCGMIGSFRKANDFRTPWGMEIYLSRGRPTMRERMEREPVPLLINNGGYLEKPLEGRPSRTFHPQDYAAIRETYVKFAGDIYLAGKKLSPAEMREWEVLVPGTYTVHGSMAINGTQYANGSLIMLKRGIVELENTGSTDARLIWGRDLQAASTSSPIIKWTGF